MLSDQDSYQMCVKDVEEKFQRLSERPMKLARMLCSSCNAQSTDASPIIDIERVLQDYAWRELKRDSRWYHVLRRNDYVIEVPWNFFEFEHKTMKFAPRHEQTDDGYREKKQVELFSTDCKNNTGKDQVYKLKTERQTKASTVVTFHRGFTMRGNAHFKLRIPSHIGNCGLMASADGHLRVTSCKGQAFDEVFTWTVDSDIKVEAYHMTNAKLIVTEDELIADFEVRTRLRMPTGEAPIIIKRRRDKQIYAVLVISDLSDAFADVDCSIVNILRENEDSKKGQYVVELLTTGMLESIRWRDQRISMESQRIPSAPHIGTSFPPPEELSETAMYSTNMLTRMLQQATKEVELGFPSADMARAPSPPHIEPAPVPDVHTKVERKGLRFNVIPTIITDVHEDEGNDSIDTVVDVLPMPPGVHTTSIMKHRGMQDVDMEPQADSIMSTCRDDKPVTVTYYSMPEMPPLQSTIGPQVQYDLPPKPSSPPPSIARPSTPQPSIEHYSTPPIVQLPDTPPASIYPSSSTDSADKFAAAESLPDPVYRPGFLADLTSAVEERPTLSRAPPLGTSEIKWTSLEARTSFDEKPPGTHIDTPDSIDSHKISKVTSV